MSQDLESIKPEVRHICGISGGKDSSAMAIYMMEKVPQMEYFFCDTGPIVDERFRTDSFLLNSLLRNEQLGGYTWLAFGSY